MRRLRCRLAGWLYRITTQLDPEIGAAIVVAALAHLKDAQASYEAQVAEKAARQ